MTDTWPIIIGGCHRSGTTLLRRIVNAHPDIFCPSEIKFHKDLLNQFARDPLAHGRLGATIDALGLPRDQWFDTLGRAFVSLYETAALKAGKKRWADKNPENCLNVEHWRRLLEGKHYFVLIVRHPLDVLASMEEVRMDRVIPVEAEARALHISSHVKSGLDFASHHPETSHTLRFEDLVTQPHATLTSLFEKVRTTIPEDLVQRSFGLSYPKAIEDPKAKHYRSLDTSRVGRWPAELDEATIAAAEPHLEWMRREWDYAW